MFAAKRKKCLIIIGNSGSFKHGVHLHICYEIRDEIKQNRFKVQQKHHNGINYTNFINSGVQLYPNLGYTVFLRTYI